MPMLTPGQHQQLLKMLDQSSINETHGVANMAGKTTFFLNEQDFTKWIVDTGATNHMIRSIYTIKV